MSISTSYASSQPQPNATTPPDWFPVESSILKAISLTPFLGQLIATVSHSWLDTMSQETHQDPNQGHLRKIEIIESKKHYNFTAIGRTCLEIAILVAGVAFAGFAIGYFLVPAIAFGAGFIIADNVHSIRIHNEKIKAVQNQTNSSVQ